MGLPGKCTLKDCGCV